MSTGVQIAALVVSAIGTGASVVQQSRAQKATEKGDAVARAQAELENQRSIRQALAQSKIDRAQLAAAGEAQTGSFGGSSAVTGALGAARTQAGANIGFARQVAGANDALNFQRGRANRAISSANIFAGVAGLPTAFGFDPKTSAQGLAKKFGQPVT